MCLYANRDDDDLQAFFIYINSRHDMYLRFFFLVKCLSHIYKCQTPPIRKTLSFCLAYFKVAHFFIM